jgi:hypothetical protein
MQENEVWSYPRRPGTIATCITSPSLWTVRGIRKLLSLSPSMRRRSGCLNAPGEPAGSAKIGIICRLGGSRPILRTLGRARPCSRTRNRSARARLRSGAKGLEVAVGGRAEVSGNRG